MQSIKYVVLGGVGGEFERQGTVADLLMAVPYLLMSRIIPPLPVTNDLLMRGRVDAGMSGGCRWDPFQLTEAEWGELVEHLKSLPDDKACEFVPPADWVENIDDWQVWIMIFRHGFPAQYRELEREARMLESARKKAVQDGNQELTLELHLRVIEVGNRIAEMAMEANQRNTRE